VTIKKSKNKYKGKILRVSIQKDEVILKRKEDQIGIRLLNGNIQSNSIMEQYF